MTSREQLSFVIGNANKQVQRIQALLRNAGNEPSMLSYSDKVEINELAKKFLLNMNSVSNIVEKDQSLMMASVPGFEGPIPAIAWMGWAMQWFDQFEKWMKPALDSVPDRTTSSFTSSYQSGGSTYTSSGNSTRKSEGCYIATMAYGDYDHPQVVALRHYRDDSLLPSFWGRLFVKIYYWISPKLVKILSGHETINSFIRRRLDSFVDHISK